MRVDTYSQVLLCSEMYLLVLNKAEHFTIRLSLSLSLQQTHKLVGSFKPKWNPSTSCHAFGNREWPGEEIPSSGQHLSFRNHTVIHWSSLFGTNLVIANWLRPPGHLQKDWSFSASFVTYETKALK